MTDQAVHSGRLNVDVFVKARQAEIEKLENHIANASGKKRTFQKVPRVLRRRTASHNPKRVPKRMRARALEEFNKDKPVPPKKRRKIEVKAEYHEEDLVGTNKLCELPKGKRYQQRQKAQVWLPTHIWHRKRAKMTARWSYVVPTTPTQKQYRVNHRVLNLSKNAALAWDTSYYGTMLVSASANELERWFPGVSKPLYRSRSWQGVAKDNGSDLGPCLVYTMADKCMVQAHPAIYETLFNGLPFDKQDLRFAIGSIDLIGSRAMTTLCRAVPGEWSRLGGVQNLDALPWHGVLSVNVQDPRFSFPPNKSPIKSDPATVRKACSSLFADAVSDSLFGTGRSDSYKTKLSQKDVEARKIPGEAVKALESDPVIPMMLFKLDDARVRVLMPWHWVLPTWLNIVDMPQVYIGGTAQFEQLAFEQGLAQFPKDYPFTPSGGAAAEALAENQRAAHDARPSRLRHMVVDAGGDPFKLQWSHISEPKPVSVSVVKRGAPTDNARIFELEGGSWVDSSTGPEFRLGRLLGYVTSGSYNLSSGLGSGVGYASVAEGHVAIKNAGKSDKLMLAKIEPRTKIYL